MEKLPRSAEPDKETFTSVIPFNGFTGPTMQMATWPIQMWLQWQAAIFKAATPAATDWMERRSEGSRATLLAVQQLCSCEDAAEIAKIQNQWMADESKRLEQDFRSLSNSLALWPKVVATANSQSNVLDGAA